MQQSADHPGKPRIAIIGAGSIGVGFTVVHLSRGHRVTVFDSDEGQRASAESRVAGILDDLASFDLLEREPAAILDKLRVVDSPAAAVADADLVHECAPENLELKRELLRELDAAAPADAVIASASSAMTASQFAAHLEGRARCLVAHPGNPPFLVSVVEIVPAPFTAGAAVARAGEILAAAGMSPVTLRREVPGFVFNRLQGALLREAYCLVRDGVAGVDDIDRIVRDGLGLRWSVVGPFETVDLNTQGGIERHAALLGPAYAAMGAERGQHDPWTPELVAKVTAERRALLPLSERDERVRWRNRRLMEMLAARRGAS